MNINYNTTWTAGSVVNLTGEVQIAPGVVLAVEPGVTVNANGYKITVYGTLQLAGTQSAPVKLNQAVVGFGSSYNTPGDIQFNHVEMAAGSFLAPNGYGAYGRFDLVDSKFTGVNGFYFWYPTGPSTVTRNVFDGSEGLSIGTNQTGTLTVTNNVFASQTGGAAVEVWANYNNGITVTRNSFLSTDRVAIELPKGYSSASLIATSNYFGTDSTSTVNAMILDRTDSLERSAVVDYAPLLMQPDPATPVLLWGIVYHWKSHALLSGVNVSVGSATAVQANAGDLFDLRGAKFDGITGKLSVEVWANASASFGNFDFRVATAGATTASFTSALPESWVVTVGADNPQSVQVSAISLAELTGSVKLGTLQLTLPTSTTAAELAFSQIKVGSADGANQGVAMQARTTAGDGAYSFTSLGSQALQLMASRNVSDSGSAVTSADALAALRIAVGLNPNPDPDGASGPKTAPAVSPYQIMAADVNGSGTVTSADALAILRMAVKLSTALPQEWFFVEERRDFWDEATQKFTLSRTAATWDRTITADPAGGVVNLVGVLKGDVNGSWTPPVGSQDLDVLDPTYFQRLAELVGVPNQDQWGGPPPGP